MRTTVQSDAEALELGTSVFDLKLRAVMCVPLTPQESEGEGASALRIFLGGETLRYRVAD